MSALALSLVALAAVVALLGLRSAADAGARARRAWALIGHAPELAIAVVDGDLRVELFEGLGLARAGWNPGELVGLRLDEVLPPERAAELGAHVTAALAGETVRGEWSGVHSDLVFRIDVLPFEDGTRAVVVFRDMDAEKLLQRSLEEQRGFLAAVLAELGDHVRVADAAGRLLAFDGSENQDLHPLEWAEHFGLRHLDGRPFGPHETPLLRALRGERLRDVELRAGERMLLASGGPVLGAGGEQLGAVTVSADLTAYREAESRLRRSEERHRRVVESVSDCVFESDAQGRWTHLSDAWEDATGYPVQESLGRPSWDFVHPDDRAAHARAFAPLLAGERVALRHEHRFLTAAGAERWGEVQVRAISGWDGLPTGFVGVMRDVTDERRARQHEAAEQAVMRQLATMQDLDDGGPELLGILARELGWDGAELWRMAADERLRRFAHWTAPGVSLARVMAAGERLAFEVGDGYPGLAWMSREPLWKTEIAGDESLVRLHEGLAEGVRSAVALPLRVDGMPVGVLVFLSRTPRDPEPGLVRLLESIGALVTQVLQRREAEGRAARQAQDLRTLSAVAHELAVETDEFAARQALCRAVRDVMRASSATLWEPRADALAVTSSVGTAVQGLVVEADPREPAARAYLSGELQFIADLAGRPGLPCVSGCASAAWFPVARDGRCVAVLAVGWGALRPELSERDHELLRLLAAEAAITLERSDLLARLQSTARTDPLTGLPNRRVWDEDLERELARAERHGGSLCLAMLDLDRFKAFNDRFGHPAGDQLLAATAAAWGPELRTTDTLARYGGEEFAVLLPHSDEEGARLVIERLLAVVPLGQTASAGLALWDGVESAAELLARADAALYAAKNAGRARALLAS